MKELFFRDEERQREVERLCDGLFPGFGYAVLVNLIALEGGCFNVALTTNFDDLIPDALYLYTDARPLVIQHESLARFIRPTRTRPLVVKLHGDQRLSPLNTSEETDRLKGDIEEQVAAVLNDRGLIFMGYGGNDKSIMRLLDGLPEAALPLGAFWVSGEEPRGEIRPWLEQRDAIWVEKGDFDELMLLIRDIFDLPHPDARRFNSVFERYTDTYESLSQRVTALPDTVPDAAALKKAVKRADEAFPDEWAAILAASRLRETEPEQAEVIYEQAIEQFPNAADVLGAYGFFLSVYRKDHDRAAEYYLRAIDADPSNPEFLSNYAIYFQVQRRDYDRAGEYYRRALAADPNYANPLANYAGLLLARGSSREGHQMLNRVLELPELSERSDIAAEAWFYALAHRPEEGRREAVQNLKRLLVAGARSPDWSLEANIARAREDGHTDIDWLEKLAAVIADEADITTLSDWPAWKKA